MADSPDVQIIASLFNKGQPLSFEKGSIILGNDPEPDGVYFIQSGYIKAYSISDDGDHYLHIIYGSGELFPLIWAYLGQSTEDVYYEAVSDIVVWRISRDWFSRYVRNDTVLGYAISQQLAVQFQIFEDRVDNLEYKKAGERVAYRLLFLAHRFGRKEQGEIVIDLPLTHELFATSINLARETVSRQLENLEKQFIVRQDQHNFVVQNVQALIGKLSKPNNIKNWNL